MDYKKEVYQVQDTTTNKTYRANWPHIKAYAIELSERMAGEADTIEDQESEYNKDFDNYDTVIDTLESANVFIECVII